MGTLLIWYIYFQYAGETDIVSNVYVSNIQMYNAQNGARIKVFVSQRILSLFVYRPPLFDYMCIYAHLNKFPQLFWSTHPISSPFII
jgi:hypothetical protein